MPAWKNRIEIILLEPLLLNLHGYKAVLEQDYNFSVIGQAREGIELFLLLPQEKPDIVVLEIMLEDDDPMEIISDIRSSYPEVKIVVLSELNGSIFKYESILHGAVAYIHKSCEPDEFALALRSVYEQGYYSNDPVTKEALALLKNGKRKKLSDKIAWLEKKVQTLKFICENKTREEVADILKMDETGILCKAIFMRTEQFTSANLLGYAFKNIIG